MTEKVGGIEYSIEADTTGVVDAQGVVNSSSKKMQDSFNRVDAAAKKLNTTQNKLPIGAKKVSSSLGGVGKSAGAASIQLQQFFGQVQGGVNPMVALSQQGADLGIVLGAPLIGSVVGISAALASSFMPNVFKSKTALEELEEITTKISKTMDLSSNGVSQYSESLRKLANRSESLAKVQIAIGIEDASKKIKVAAVDISRTILDLSQGSFKGFNAIIEESGLSVEEFSKKLSKPSVKLNAMGDAQTTVSGLARKLSITKDEAFGLARSISEFANNRNIKGVNALESSLEGLNQKSEFGNKKLVKFTNQLIPMLEAIRNGTDVTNKFESALKSLSTALEEETNSDALVKIKTAQESISQQLSIQKVQLTEGENAAQRLAIAYGLGLENASQLPQSIKDALTETENLEAAQKKAAEDKIAATKKQAEIERAIRQESREEEIAATKKQAEIERAIRQESREEEIANRKVMAEFDKLSGVLQQGGMSELEKIQADFEAKRELILEHEAILLGDKTLSDEQLIALEQKTSDTLLAIEADKAKKEEELAEIEKQGKISAVRQTFGALSSLMNTESKKLFEIGKAAAIAGAIVDGYAAVSKTMASVPYPFNIPLAAAQAVASAVQVQNIAKQKVGGAKSMGAATSFQGGTPSVNTNNGGGNQDRNITIAGIDSSSLITGGQLVDTLNKALGDGYTVNFA